jgi:hypothetical protein
MDKKNSLAKSEKWLVMDARYALFVSSAKHA